MARISALDRNTHRASVGRNRRGGGSAHRRLLPRRLAGRPRRLGGPMVCLWSIAVNRQRGALGAVADHRARPPMKTSSSILTATRRVVPDGKLCLG